MVQRQRPPSGGHHRSPPAGTVSRTHHSVPAAAGLGLLLAGAQVAPCHPTLAHTMVLQQMSRVRGRQCWGVGVVGTKVDVILMKEWRRG